jgi:hypothetical protein
MICSLLIVIILGIVANILFLVIAYRISGKQKYRYQQFEHLLTTKPALCGWLC